MTTTDTGAALRAFADDVERQEAMHDLLRERVAESLRLINTMTGLALEQLVRRNLDEMRALLDYPRPPRALLGADTAVEWGARWADGGYCPATPPRSEDFAHKHARNFGTRAIYRKVGPWKYADTGELAFPEQADRGIAAGEDQL